MIDAWERCGAAKIVVKVQSEAELCFFLLVFCGKMLNCCRLGVQKQAASLKLPTYLVRDAGRTQIAAGSKTVLAVGPGIVDLSVLFLNFG